MSKADVRIDVVIIGGGIAGLWLLDSLQAAGFSALVLNKGDLGQGQSVASQGIIHGGTKYFSDSTVADLAPMPARWRASLSGQQGPDLRPAAALAEAMQMWLPPQLGGGVMSRFAQATMLRQVQERPACDWPSVLAQDSGGHLFDVDEAVIDIPEVLAALQNLHHGRVRGLPEGTNLSLSESSQGGMIVDTGTVRIQTQRLVLTAGAGNEILLDQAGLPQFACQRRPLRQVIVRGMTQPIFMHCIGKNPKPLATITSHPDGGNGYYWYVGGLLAEKGVAQDPAELIRIAKAELRRLLPGADFSQSGWATHHVDRAEPAGQGGLRPGSALALRQGAVIVGWPTKLALAPVLADKIVALLRADEMKQGVEDIDALDRLPTPVIAQPPWQAVRQWN
ncbi:MAG: FAD-dependent oxidoreductase [Alphaproteobacteria bacterium]|jgi:glycine/D-amino acid oxidase-like deaminating enzyme|nr:FAD-dependent oxidoreductase [Alphaproteobacteria bacterium]